MKKKVKTETLVMAAALLAQVNIDKMEAKEKSALIHATYRIRKATEDYNAILKDAGERLKPHDFDALAAKEQSGQELTAEEQARVRTYNGEVRKCVRPELDREVELDFEPLTEDGVLNLSRSNPQMPLGTVMELMSLLCDCDGTGRDHMENDE